MIFFLIFEKCYNYVYVHMGAGTFGGQKELSNVLELKWQVVVNSPTEGKNTVNY